MDASVIDSVSTGGTSTGSLYLQFVGSTYIFQRSGTTVLSGTNTVHAGGVGARNVGWVAGPYTSDANNVTMDNFFAGDIGPLAMVAGITSPIIRTRLQQF
jgi:hypothetical protein